MPKSAKLSKSMKSQMQEIARDELKQELEEKKAIISYDQVSMNSNIPSGDVQNSNNYFRLLPSIRQISSELTSTTDLQGGYNIRVGDEITLKRLDLKGYVAYNDITKNNEDSVRTGVRVMILRQRDENTDVGFIANSHANKLLVDSEIGIPGPGSFSGVPLNLLDSINRDAYAVRYDKVFNLSASLQVAQESGTNAAKRFTGSQNNTLKFFQHQLSFGKRGLKLKYTEGDSEDSNNFPYVMVVGYANLIDDGVASNGAVKLTMSAVAHYTDA